MGSGETGTLWGHTWLLFNLLVPFIWPYIQYVGSSVLYLLFMNVLLYCHCLSEN